MHKLKHVLQATIASLACWHTSTSPQCCIRADRIPHVGQPLPGRTFIHLMRPHSLFRRLVSVLLAMLLLITSVGFSVQRLTYSMRGRSTVTDSVAGRAGLRGCRSERAPAKPKALNNCYDFSEQEHGLSSPAHELAAKIPVPVSSISVIVPPLNWPVAPAAMASLAESGHR